MDSLNNDEVSLIMFRLLPIDWWCLSLSNRSWSQVIQKWLNKRKIEFKKRLDEVSLLFGVAPKEMKNSVCIIPLYYPKHISTFCLGEVKRWTCARHSTLSSQNLDLCEKCKKNPVSTLCYNRRCGSVACRDYMFVLQNGEAIKVPCFPCRVPECQKPSDSSKGFCFGHAIEVYPKIEREIPKYQCIGKTKAGNDCRYLTSSRSKKCHLHSSKILI